MPRNSSGTYTLPSSNPVVPNTLIETAWANPTMSDIGSGLTDSLDRNGRGAMLAPLKLVLGSVAAPAVSWSAESTSGLYRVGSNILGMSIAGIERQRWDTTGATITGNTTVTGNLTVTGTTTTGGAVGPLTVTGNLIVTGTTALNGGTTIGDAIGDALTITSGTMTFINPTTHTNNHTFSGDVSINGNTAIGNAAGDTLTIAPSVVSFLNSPSIGGSLLTFSGSVNFNGVTNFSGGSTLTVAGGASLIVNGTAAFNAGTTIGDAAGDAFTINSSAVTIPNGLNFDANTLVIDAANNRVGIGVAPSNDLHVQGASGLTAIRISAITDGLLGFVGSGSGLAGGASSNSLALRAENGLILSGSGNSIDVSISGTEVKPGTNNTKTSGSSALRWSNLFSVLGNFSGTITSSATGNGISQSSSNPGAGNFLAVQNTSTTASSSAGFYVQVAGASSGDPTFQCVVGGGATWTHGIDVSDSQAYVIATTSALGAGNALRISTAGAVTVPGTLSAADLFPSTWTPTLTADLNIGASTPQLCHYTRVGVHVDAWGSIYVDPVAASIPTSIYISLPIASNMNLTTDAAGNANRELAGTLASLGGYVIADTINDRVELIFVNDTDVLSRRWFFRFSYEIK